MTATTKLEALGLRGRSALASSAARPEGEASRAAGPNFVVASTVPALARPCNGMAVRSVTPRRPVLERCSLIEIQDECQKAADHKHDRDQNHRPDRRLQRGRNCGSKSSSRWKSTSSGDAYTGEKNRYATVRSSAVEAARVVLRLEFSRRGVIASMVRVISSKFNIGSSSALTQFRIEGGALCGNPRNLLRPGRRASCRQTKTAAVANKKKPRAPGGKPRSRGADGAWAEGQGTRHHHGQHDERRIVPRSKQDGRRVAPGGRPIPPWAASQTKEGWRLPFRALAARLDPISITPLD
jgi:hypothetical protein